MAGFGASTSSIRKAGDKLTPRLRKWREANTKEIFSRGGQGSADYLDSLRSAVEELGVLSPAQSVRQTEEIFENPDGTRRSVEGIKRGYARKDVQIVNTQNGPVIYDNGYINDAGPRAAKQGIFQPDISKLSSITGTSIQVPETAGNVESWINDPVARARFIPEEVDLSVATPAVVRAYQIGNAEASGDRQAVFDANQRYSFTDEEIDTLGGDLLIGKVPLRSQVRIQGLGGRDKIVVNPATGELVAEMTGPMRNQYYRDRANIGLSRYFGGGGTGFGDGRSNVVIPGFNYQLEHDRPFSGSIDVLGLEKSDYFSDTADNTAGYYERYENAEKGEVGPTDYYRMRRLHALAADEGLKLSGIAKADGGEVLTGESALKYILERDNPSVIKGDRRRKNAQDTLLPERELQNRRLVEQALAARTKK